MSDGNIIDLSLSEEDIVGKFEKYLDSIITTFNDLLRPEFCKVQQLSLKKYQS